MKDKAADEVMPLTSMIYDVPSVESAHTVTSWFDDFTLPFQITHDQLTVTQSLNSTSRTEAFAKEVVCRGFKKESRLRNVSYYIIQKFARKEGGNWLCNIKPTAIKQHDSVRYHFSGKCVDLSFTRDKIPYCVSISQTSPS